jgi:2-dehydro-3-deoxyphosphooctonate aldolase (KDO 8-P synthase)
LRLAQIGGHTVGDGRLAVIAGPCVIESESHVLRMADALRGLFERLEVPFVFKASFDKANRSSVDSYRGPGQELGLAILARVREDCGVPVITDIHTPDQAAPVAEAVDALQIPAFLCRQTDLLVAAGRTGLPVNIKKGQMVQPQAMAEAARKVEAGGESSVLLCERGTTFGYGNLVVDMRGLAIMRDLGYPVVFDATHSVQLPGAAGTASGGDRRFAPGLARAAVAVGVDAVFMEVHDDPDAALCDGPNMLPLGEVEPLIRELLRIHDARGRSG